MQKIFKNMIFINISMTNIYYINFQTQSYQFSKRIFQNLYINIIISVLHAYIQNSVH